MMRWLLIAVVPMLVAAASPGRPVGLAAHPGTKADAAARQLVAQDLLEARRTGDEPLVLTATAPLGGPRAGSVLFVQLQSPRECGSAGCSTSAFQPDGRGWRKVLDAVSGPILVQDVSHKGMRDLVVGGSRFSWTGTTYAGCGASGVLARFEQLLFASRWLQAPLYVGLALSLALLLVRFAVSGFDLALHGFEGGEDHLIVAVLGLVDLTLVANLVLMVMFAGYETFVSRLNSEAAERLGWMGQIGFTDLKLKLMGSIVAISAIHLLEDFMNVHDLPDRDLGWRAGLHGLFVVSGLVLAAMDRLSHHAAEDG